MEERAERASETMSFDDSEWFRLGFQAAVERLADFLFDDGDGGPSVADVRKFVSGLHCESYEAGGEG